MRVAYATHWRALMEFAHDRRPTPAERRSAGCAAPKDVTAAHLLGAPILRQWSPAEIARLCDADQLAAHLSETRIERSPSGREWGGDEDWRLIEPVILALIDSNSVNLPRSMKLRSAWWRGSS